MTAEEGTRYELSQTFETLYVDVLPDSQKVKNNQQRNKSAKPTIVMIQAT